MNVANQSTVKPQRSLWQHWQFRLKTWFGASPLAGDAIPLLLSVVVGLVTGLGAYVFIQLLEQISHLTAALRDTGGIIAGLALMVAAGAVVGMIISRFASEAKGHGVPEVMEAIALRRGRIRPHVAVAKIIASALTIGAGGSAGREGPIVQVGSAVGSTVGQWTRLSDEQVSMLVAGGAAAGIAATFNAPIAGSMFALEVILGRFSNRYLGMVVISAVSANVVSRILLGANPAFQVPAYPLNSVAELPLYLVLAVVCAVGAVGFIRVLYGAEHIFDHWAVPLPVRTAVGMGLTGLVAIFAPEVLGSGLEFIGEAIAGDINLALELLITLFVLKLLATAFTLGAGNSGGVFAPGLFMGAMLGGIIGQLGQQVFPETVIDPGAFALVGMAAMFAGAARSPITAIIIVLEMSNDYRLILPLLMTVMVSTLLADFIQRDSIYTRKLSLRGIRLDRGQDVDVLQGVRVDEVMSRNYTRILPETKLVSLIPMFNETHHHGFPIVDANHQLKGIVTLTDVENAQDAGVDFEATVLDIGTTTDLIVVYPDDPIYVALRRMNIYSIGRLPVVARDDPGRYLGMVRRQDVLKAYDVGLARKTMDQQRARRIKLRNVEDNRFIEVQVVPGAPMVGRTLAEFPHSDRCLLISVLRGGRNMIAHGSTRIEVGDLITAYAIPDVQDKVIALFAAPSASLDTEGRHDEDEQQSVTGD